MKRLIASAIPLLFIISCGGSGGGSQQPQNQFSLSVTKSGTGSGTITSTPAGINCGGTCQAAFNSGTTVILNATPDANSTFAGWSGDPDCSDGQVTMDANKTCTATFTSSVSTTENSPFGFLSIPPTEFEYYKDLGISWIVVGEFDWQIIEKTKGEYDFSEMDKQLSNWTQHGLNLHYRVRPINEIYGTYWNEMGDSYEYPNDMNAWSEFIEAFAERYNGDGVDDAPTNPKIVINSYQLVHELSGNKNYWLAHPDQYAEVFEVTYKALKKANPNAILYMPVPNYYFMSAGIPVDPGEKTFLTDVLSRLENKGIVDIGFDYHHWAIDLSQVGPGKLPEAAWQTDGKKEYHWHAEYIRIIKETAAKYGFNNPKIVSLESGMAGTEEMEKNQAGYVIRSYVTSLAHGQTRQFWTTIEEYSHYDDNNLFTYVGLVNNPKNDDGLSHKKLAYYTYKKMVEVLEGSDWKNIQTVQESDGIYIYKFTKQGKSIWVAWNDNPTERQITISGINSSQVKVTEAVPNYQSGKDVTDYNTAFKTETKTVTGGQVTIALGDSPVFVEVLQ